MISGFFWLIVCSISLMLCSAMCDVPIRVSRSMSCLLLGVVISVSEQKSI